MWKKELASEFKLRPRNFEILLFRDVVLPKLLDNAGTAYYDDELQRTLSLINVYNEQRKTDVLIKSKEGKL